MKRALVVVALVACKTAPQITPAQVKGPTFDQRVGTFYDEHMKFRPQLAIELGLHAYDGEVPDRSREAIEVEITRLHDAERTFAAFDDNALADRERVQREIILTEIRKELFELEVRRRPFRDPTYYLFKFSLAPYISREYDTQDQRRMAMWSACSKASTYYAQALTNLEAKIPKAYLLAARMIAMRTVEFLERDAYSAFDEVNVQACVKGLAKELTEWVKKLEAWEHDATDEFRLGADNLVAMLKATEGIEIDIPTLEKLARDDLAKNRAAITLAAKQIDPNRDVVAVVAEVSSDKPADVINEANAQLARLRKFIVDKQIVSLPRNDLVEVRASPPFMRGNFAALGGVGPFERSPLPSFYYISPPDPKWPEAQQRAYVMSRADMLFTSVHEVYPGHFVQGMHERASGSSILQTFETYTASEGWAHYVEQMMWEQGLGDGDPRVHIGQLKNALLRDVRFIVALGYHAGNMTPDEAEKLFAEQAFADPGNAKQQALRGTVDPMFLGYTLGKLLILQLRADWMVAHPKATLREFHDEFLRYGEAPLPVTRRLMLPTTASHR